MYDVLRKWQLVHYKGARGTHYISDYRPVNVYINNIKHAGWKLDTKSGVSLEWENTYNDKVVSAVVSGQSVQNGTPSPENPVPIISTGEDGGISIAVYGSTGQVFTDNRNVILRSSPSGKRDTWEPTTGVVTRYILTTMFDGSESWAYVNTVGSTALFQYNLIPSQVGDNTYSQVLCTHLVYAGSLYDTSTVGIAGFNADTGFYIRIRVPTSIATDAATFKSWLAAQYSANTPVIVQYDIAEPVSENIEPLAIPTYPKYTHLVCSENIEATVRTSTPQPYKIYGVAIDLTNSNPETAVTYTDDAVGMTGGDVAWDSMAIFKDIKPCVLKNGVVQYYLNPNDFTKKADGTPADIESGNDGDVMIEIPKIGYSISTAGNTLTVKVTDDPNNPNFKYYAHSRAAEGDRQKLYIGAYKGYKDGSNKLRSLSGKTPTADQTIGTFRTQAQANGAGYDIVSFYPLTLLQCLYLIKYKNLDSQTALGQGYTGGSAAQSTGATNTAGMCYGSTSTTSRVKLFGIEDFWGNVWEWIDGLLCDSNRNIKTAFQNFNDTGSGYTDRGQGATSDISGFMSKPQGTSEAGFIAKEASGSTTTHFTDNASLGASRLPAFGGVWNNGDNAGVFCLLVNRAADNSASNTGARLMYL